MHLSYPYHIDGRGRTAMHSEDARYARDLIEQVLFTRPGERVNQPEFGSDIMGLVFEANSDALTSATEFIVQSSLQRWLGDLITVESLSVEAVEGELRITIIYLLRRTMERHNETFSREI
jgi:phage baseplate assembly protein W